MVQTRSMKRQISAVSGMVNSDRQQKAARVDTNTTKHRSHSNLSVSDGQSPATSPFTNKDPSQAHSRTDPYLTRRLRPLSNGIQPRPTSPIRRSVEMPFHPNFVLQSAAHTLMEQSLDKMTAEEHKLRIQIANEWFEAGAQVMQGRQRDGVNQERIAWLEAQIGTSLTEAESKDAKTAALEGQLEMLNLRVDVAEREWGNMAAREDKLQDTIETLKSEAIQAKKKGGLLRGQKRG